MKVVKFDSFASCKIAWTDIEEKVPHFPFQTWWYQNLFAKHFSDENNIYILGIFEDETLLAIGAFEIVDEKVLFIGTKNVSKTPGLIQDITDFGDILYADAYSDKEAIWQEIFTFFKQNNHNNFQLNYIRQDSPTYSVLKEKGDVQQVETSPFIDLPATWDEYLGLLNRKHRHELKRKISRLERETAFHLCKDQTVEKDFQEFIRLHKLSDFEKEKFMTSDMASFFWDLVTCEKGQWEIHFCSLFIDNKQVASVMAFMKKNQTLLYNSGFDPAYGHYSVGLLVKSFLLKKSIEQGKKIYDFLRGNERYKYDLGAKDMPLFKIDLQL